MTGDEVVALLPRLRRLADAKACNGVDADDLVQEAALALLEDRKRATNPLVAACSVMTDEIRHRGYFTARRVGREWRRLHAGSTTSLPARPEPPPVRDTIFWDHFDLTPHDRMVARLYFEEGLTQAEVGRRLGQWQTAISKSLRRIGEAVAERLAQVTGGDF